MQKTFNQLSIDDKLYTFDTSELIPKAVIIYSIERTDTGLKIHFGNTVMKTSVFNCDEHCSFACVNYNKETTICTSKEEAVALSVNYITGQLKELKNSEEKFQDLLKLLL